MLTDEEAKAIAERAMNDLAAPPCTNCHHPFMEHTGRTLFTMDKEPQRGRWCEHEIDFHHSCSCPRYVTPHG